MSNEQKLKEFTFEGESGDVNFIETMQVAPGVECDVYSFSTRDDMDLGIIRIGPGARTPLQRVLKGLRTVEGYVSGTGLLIVNRSGGEEETYLVQDGKQGFQIDVGIGDTMQWQADDKTGLNAFEICIPPYEDGRYENIS